MPRAENRKRPPSSYGGGREQGKGSRSVGGQVPRASDEAQDKKRQLVERMRKIQEEKTSGSPS